MKQKTHLQHPRSCSSLKPTMPASHAVVMHLIQTGQLMLCNKELHSKPDFDEDYLGNAFKFTELPIYR